ncbi:hypothetical protein QTP88_018037 [Uroleucon formosanum]
MEGSLPHYISIIQSPLTPQNYTNTLPPIFISSPIMTKSEYVFFMSKLFSFWQLSLFNRHGCNTICAKIGLPLQGSIKKRFFIFEIIRIIWKHSIIDTIRLFLKFTKTIKVKETTLRLSRNILNTYNYFTIVKYRYEKYEILKNNFIFKLGKIVEIYLHSLDLKTRTIKTICVIENISDGAKYSSRFLINGV